LQRWGLGTSQRDITRNFYFKMRRLLLVVQITWLLLDKEGDQLSNPKKESENRFYLKKIKLQK
jgi:hypothetical protein